MDDLFERPKKDTKPRRGRPPGRKNNKTLAKEAEMRAKQEQVSKSIRKYDDEDDEDDLLLCDLEDELWHHTSASVDWEKLKQYDELYLKLRGEHFVRDIEYIDNPDARKVVDTYLDFIAWNNHGNESHWMEYPEFLFEPYLDPQSILDMMEEQGELEGYEEFEKIKAVVDMLRALKKTKKGKRDRAVIWNPQTGESKTFDMSKPKDAEEVARLTEEEGWEYESYPESDMDFNKARGNEMKASKSKVEKSTEALIHDPETGAWYVLFHDGYPDYVCEEFAIRMEDYGDNAEYLSDYCERTYDPRGWIGNVSYYYKVTGDDIVNVSKEEARSMIKSKVKKDSATALEHLRQARDLIDKADDELMATYSPIEDERLFDLFTQADNSISSCISYVKNHVEKSNSVAFKSHTGTFKPIAKAGHYTMWQSVEHGDKAYNIITQTKKNSKTGQLVEKIIKERVDGFEDPEVQKMFGVKKIDRSGGIRIN